MVLFAAVFVIGNLQAEPLSRYVGGESEKDLVAGKSIKKVHLDGIRYELLPSGAMPILNTALSGFEPSLLVEALYLYRKSASTGTWSTGEKLALYNQIRSLSTLSGIEYFSASRGKMRTFYEVSYVMQGVGNRRKMPDPIVAVVPEHSTIYAFQKDLTFGDNEYKYDFFAGNEWLAFVQENLTGMSYGLVPVLGVGRLRTVVIVIDTDTGLLVYAASAARATLLPGISGKVRDSFSNRADAIYGWFEKRASVAFSLSAVHK